MPGSRSHKVSLGASAGLVLTVVMLALTLNACTESNATVSNTFGALPTLAATNTPVPATPLPNYTANTFGATQINATLTGGGSTRIAALNTLWLVAYKKIAPNVTINYQATNSGNGQMAFLGTPVPQGSYSFKPTVPLDFAGSDLAFSGQQLVEINAANKGAKLLHIPVSLGAAVVSYRLDGYSGELRLSGPTIAKIFLGQVKTWNSPEIAADNAGKTLPAKPITVIIRGRAVTGSGTSELFSRYLATFTKEITEQVGVGGQLNWPQFGQIEVANGTAAAVAVSEHDGSIAYMDQEQAEEKKLPYASIRNNTGRYLQPSPEGLTAAAQGVSIPDDFRFFVIDSQDPNAYPLAAFTWIIVWQDLSKMPTASSEKSQALAHFIWWSLHDGQRRENLSPGFAPLPAALVQRLEGLFVNGDTSKVLQFNGQPVLKYS